jgi:hypothetical protein
LIAQDRPTDTKQRERRTYPFVGSGAERRKKAEKKKKEKKAVEKKK